MQEFTSAKTSINSTKVPAVFTRVKPWGAFKRGTRNLDLGGGRYDTATEFLAGLGVENVIYDPYNRSAEHNAVVLKSEVMNGHADSVTISNVLNVIKEKDRRLGVLAIAKLALKPNAKAYITVYEGDKSGIGRETSAGYQLNKRTVRYVEECETLFENVRVRNGVIICSN
jgi:hypothetical protein